MKELAEFRDGLKRKKAEKPKPEADDVKGMLHEILSLLKNPGPMTFEITERDENGKIKSFKVTR